MSLKEKAKTHTQLTQERAKVWNAGKYKEDEKLGQILYVPLEVAEEEIQQYQTCLEILQYYEERLREALVSIRLLEALREALKK